jgi:hypothetical protein
MNLYIATNVSRQVALWVIQVSSLADATIYHLAHLSTSKIQVILQIIINRISLLLVPHDDAKRLAWLVGLLIGIINISVFIIWIPARMQVSETWIRVNSIWDRLEKAIFCVVDVSLNAYFVHLVRTKLIANGLTKYMSLLRFNLVMIFFSMSLDVSKSRWKPAGACADAAAGSPYCGHVFAE